MWTYFTIFRVKYADRFDSNGEKMMQPRWSIIPVSDFFNEGINTVYCAPASVQAIPVSYFSSLSRVSFQLTPNFLWLGSCLFTHVQKHFPAVTKVLMSNAISRWGEVWGVCAKASAAHVRIEVHFCLVNEHQAQACDDSQVSSIMGTITCIQIGVRKLTLMCFGFQIRTHQPAAINIYWKLNTWNDFLSSAVGQTESALFGCVTFIKHTAARWDKLARASVRVWILMEGTACVK